MTPSQPQATKRNPAAIIGAAILLAAACLLTMASSVVFALRCDEAAECTHPGMDYLQGGLALAGLVAATWLLIAAARGRGMAAAIAFGVTITTYVAWFGIVHALVSV